MTYVLKKIASGDRAAVSECIDLYGSLIWSLARRLSGTPADAEDATQEIFLDIWRHAERFDPAKGTEKTFIAVIARRRLIDRFRKLNQEPPMVSVDELDFGVWSNQPCDTEFEMSVDVERAARVFAQLRKDYQQVIELALLEGLSHAQIASKLGMPLGSVKSCMRRGLLQVRQLLSGPSESETGSLGG